MVAPRVSSRAGLQRLFIYGTLAVPEVMFTVAGRRLALAPATLPGFHCARVTGAAYPGVVPRPGALTRGWLASGLTPRVLARLDRYEGPLYRRRRVRVNRADGASRRAWVYALRPGRRHRASRHPWDLEAFVARHLGDYLARRC